MWRKIIAFLYAIGYLWAAFDAARTGTALTVITVPFLLPALGSLFLFAFDRRLLPKLLWKAYAIMFVLYWTLPLMFGAKILIGESGLWAYLIIVAVCVLFLSPVVRSLWWLSFARAELGWSRSTENAAPTSAMPRRGSS